MKAVRKFIAPLVLAIFVSSCAHSVPKDAINAEAALAASYRVAAPLRADMCRDGILSAKVCADSLRVLKVDYQLLQEYGKVLKTYLQTKDESLLAQLKALLPQVVEAVTRINSLIGGFRNGS